MNTPPQNVGKMPKQYSRDLIDFAAGYGWVFEKKSDHGGGVLWCPAHECSLRLYATARGGESWAKTASQKVERCRHVQPTALATAKEHARKAERLIGAAETQQAIDCKETAAEQLLELLENGEKSLKDAERNFDRVTADSDEMRAALDPQFAGETALCLVERGSEEIDAASAVTRKMSRASDDVEDLRRELSGLRERVRRLRQRLIA